MGASAPYLFDKQGAGYGCDGTNTACDNGRQCVGVVVEELDVAEDGGEYCGWLCERSSCTSSSKTTQKDRDMKVDVPTIGPRNIPRLPVNAKKEKARAWVLWVLFSLIMVRIVLW